MFFNCAHLETELTFLVHEGTLKTCLRFYKKEINFVNLVIVFVLVFQDFRNAWMTGLLWNENDFYNKVNNNNNSNNNNHPE
jgi:hypothetical protein